jgi:hypothetical protein
VELKFWGPSEKEPAGIEDMVFPQLQAWYEGNQDYVCNPFHPSLSSSHPSQLFRLSLTMGSETRTGGKPLEQKVAKMEEFLKNNPTAKIVVLVDTHSDQDGLLLSKVQGTFIYSNTLGQVRDCFKVQNVNSLTCPRSYNSGCVGP